MVFCSRCGTAWDAPPERCTCGYGMQLQSGPAVLPVRCTGDGATLFGFYLKTWFLSLITLGIYSFWGRAEVRRYLYQETWLGQDRLANHTTGGELLRGWLKAAAVLLILYTAMIIAVLIAPGDTGSFFGLLVWLAFLALAPFAIVGTSRYRLSRTSFRGVHFSSTATTGEFLPVFFKGLVLSVLTLGLYAPWFINDITGYLTRNTRYGDRPFNYDGQGNALFVPFLIMLLLFIPTLSLSSFWYLARQHRHFWSSTTFGAARFQSSAQGGEMVVLGVTNLLLTVFTLGLGYAWAQVRYNRYVSESLVLVGDPGLEAVQQRAMAASATGEGMASLLDVDADVADGFGL